MDNTILKKETDIIQYIDNDNVDLLTALQSKSYEYYLEYLPSKQCCIIEYLVLKKAMMILKVLFSSDSKNEIMKMKIGKEGNLLHMAFKYEQCDIIQLISENYKEECFIEDDDGNTVMHKWVIHHFSCKKCIKLLSLKQRTMNISFTQPNNEGNNVLEIAIINGNEFAGSLLIKNFQFDYSHRDKFNETILHKIARSNLINIVDATTSKKIMMIKNNNNETCLTIALQTEHYHLAEFFLDKGIFVTLKDKQIVEGKTNIPPSLLDRIINYKYNDDTSYGFKTPEPTQSRKQVSFNYNQTMVISREKQRNSSVLHEYNINLISLNKTSNYTMKAIERYKKNPLSFSKKVESSYHNKNTRNHHNDFTNKKAKLCHTGKIRSPRRDSFKFLSSPIAKEPKESFNPRHESFMDNNSNQFSTSQNTVGFATSFNFEDIRCFTMLMSSDLQINKNEVLHYGDNCILYKGIYIGLDVIIKVFNMEKMNKETIKYLNNEILLNISLRHPNIVTCLGTCQRENEYYIITEYLEKLSLKSLLENKEIQMSLKEKLRFIYEISLGIYYIHTRSPPIHHRDLKSSNVLIDKNNTAKLCDFGIAKISNDPGMNTNSSSTPYWMAPEFIINGKFTDKSDIYSFGILMWEILTRDTIPYKNRNQFDFVLGNKEALEERPVITELLNTKPYEEIKELMCKCWKTNAIDRPSINTVVNQLKMIYNKA